MQPIDAGMSAPIPLTVPVRRLLPGSPEWPSGLDDLSQPPAQLFVAGTLPTCTSAVAVVGTRYAAEEALRFARGLGRELAQHGVTVISGGAAGIDAAAHMGALEAGGSTIAVLATGLSHAYPVQHARLFAEIAAQGALLCEYERDVGHRAWVFLKRNRLIAALAPITVVVQAPYKSGALSTARWAKSLKRRILAVPAAPWDEHGRGCVELLRGGGADICTSASEILSLASPAASGPAGARPKRTKKINKIDSLAAKSRTVRTWLRRGVRHPDEIAAALDMPAAEVQEALLDLVLQGLCRQRADGSYVVDES